MEDSSDTALLKAIERDAEEGSYFKLQYLIRSDKFIAEVHNVKYLE